LRSGSMSLTTSCFDFSDDESIAENSC
jgi:hypothetical protein